MAWPNIIDSTTVSGGSWLSSLPVTNIQNKRISKVARSTNTNTTSTIIIMDLGATASAIQLLALVVHNMSVSAKVRITSSDFADFSTTYYSSGWVDVWPAGVIPQELLEWEEDNFWLGTISQNAIAGYRAPYTHYLPSSTNSRYWKIEIDDTGNTDGYIQVGRVFLGKVWSPTYNMGYGMKFGYTDVSTSESSLTGEEFFDIRTRYRTHTFELPALLKAEAYSTILAMQQQLGTSGEILVSGDRDDTTNTPRICFLGRMVSLSPISADNPLLWNTQFEIKEIL